MKLPLHFTSHSDLELTSHLKPLMLESESIEHQVNSSSLQQ